MNTMQEELYDGDVEDTLSLSNFLMESDGSEKQFSKPNTYNNSSRSTSSSSSFSEQDFLGFFTEEPYKKTYPYDAQNIVFCGKVVSSNRGVAVDGERKPETTTRSWQTDALFRSSSDSFRFVWLKKSGSGRVDSRSKSTPNGTSLLRCKSRLRVFMFGSGSSKFPTKVDMSEMKSRQLRQHQHHEEVVDGRTTTTTTSGWWRVVDVLGCNGGYGRDTVGMMN